MVRIDGVRLAIGTDTLVLPSPWINYDIRRVRPEVMQLDVRNGLPYGDNTVVEIYGGHFFDHLSFYEGVNFLKECRRVLSPGGIVRLSVMDTNKIIEKYLYEKMGDFDELQPQIYRDTLSQGLKFAMFLLGNLAHEKEYSGHKMLYTVSSIKNMGVLGGFDYDSVQVVEPDFFREPWSVENPDYMSHTLYVEMTKGLVGVTSK